jgi:hypothetical protein
LAMLVKNSGTSLAMLAEKFGNVGQKVWQCWRNFGNVGGKFGNVGGEITLDSLSRGWWTQKTSSTDLQHVFGPPKDHR